MNPRPGLKIIAVLALFINIGASFILFGSMKNMSLSSNQTSQLSYFSIIAIIIFSFLLFLMYIISRSNAPATGSQSESNTEMKAETNLPPVRVPAETSINLEELKSKAVKIIPEDAIIPNERYSLKSFAEGTLTQIAKYYPIVEGLFFLREKGSAEFIPIGDYAYLSEKKPSGFKLGETLPGQVAKNKKAMKISEVPESYVKIGSGLGISSPGYLYFLPLINNEETIAVIEMASFKEFDKECEIVFELAAEELSKALVQLQTKNV